MPTGVHWSAEHTDITNYYIKMGVVGGLPLMVLLILVLWTGFRYAGQASRSHIDSDSGKAFVAWCLGSSLFAHATTSEVDLGVLFR